MSNSLKLVIFDVDGTLVDSQSDILGAMTRAFDAAGLVPPSRDDILGIVGLSLPVAIERLAPATTRCVQRTLVEEYKAAYVDMRTQIGAAQSSPLYEGALETLERLYQVPETLLGIATGKSKRGLDKLIEAHALERYFVTRQVADFHPSKPHPSMILQAMAEAGVRPEQTVMIGDTSFDMEMAAAAGVQAIGVSWGYHPVSALKGARFVVDGFGDLPEVLSSVWGEIS